MCDQRRVVDAGSDRAKERTLLCRSKRQTDFDASGALGLVGQMGRGAKAVRATIVELVADLLADQEPVEHAAVVLRFDGVLEVKGSALVALRGELLKRVARAFDHLPGR